MNKEQKSRIKNIIKFCNFMIKDYKKAYKTTKNEDLLYEYDYIINSLETLVIALKDTLSM